MQISSMYTSDAIVSAHQFVTTGICLHGRGTLDYRIGKVKDYLFAWPAQYFIVINRVSLSNNQDKKKGNAIFENCNNTAVMPAIIHE